MAFGTMDDDGEEVMNEINMTPLVDVMLVLLIIFIITVPVMKPIFFMPAFLAVLMMSVSRPYSVDLSARIWNGGCGSRRASIRS